MEKCKEATKCNSACRRELGLKFKRTPRLKLQKEIAEIIVWNIFQMDGLKYVIPMSCRNEKKIIIGAQTLFGKENDQVEEIACNGCFRKTSKGHNGKYVKIMNWREKKIIMFVCLIKNNK